MTVGPLPGPTVADRALVVFALAYGAVISIAVVRGVDNGLVALLSFAGWLPLLAMYRWPMAAFAAVVVIESVHVAFVPLVDPVEFTSIPATTMVAVYTIASRTPWRTGWLYGAVAAAVLLCVGTFTRDGDALATNMFALDLVLGAAAAGVLVRSRQERLAVMQRRAEDAERTKEDEARRRVASERLRMARELHDVVAHNLALVNAQSSVAEYLIRTDPEAAEKALHNLSEHTRQALDELRSTVGLLRQADPEEPAAAEGKNVRDDLRPFPGLTNLEALIDRHSAVPGGLTCTIEGEARPLATQTDLAAYRIIQEAITNARKHAPGAAVEVQLTWEPATLHIKVSNDSPPDSAASQGAGTGHGLLGMRERASASHGTLAAGERPDGGWDVTAILPTQQTNHGDTA